MGKRQKIKSIKQFTILVVAIIVLLFVGTSYYFRIDLTAEKRYTLSPITKNILKKIDQKIYFKIYLEGNLTAPYKRLQIQTKELLEEFKAISKQIHFKFEDPIEGKNSSEQLEVVKKFSEKGFQPSIIQNELQQQIIFPFFLVSNGEKRFLSSLENTQIGIPDQELVINNSVQALEFKLVQQIKKVIDKKEKKIAILTGHGELNYPEIVNFAIELDEQYFLTECNLSKGLSSLLDNSKPLYDVLVIPKPQYSFSEPDKFIIDQFIMYGGNVVWLIDAVNASLDSLKRKESTIIFPKNLNLEDQLFTYGIRINPDLVMDLYALPIPLTTGKMNGQAQIKFFPWNFFPILHPVSKHPIVKNLNAIKTEFISSIDTLEVKGVSKTILLSSSEKTKLFSTPNSISFQQIIGKQNQDNYNQGRKNIAVLLEGNFKSVYSGRQTPKGLNTDKYHRKNISKKAKMIIISDGDLVKNQLHNSSKEPLPLGYDQFTNQTFGNKEFMLNCIAYLAGDAELINLRTREVKLRLLDKIKIDEEKHLWKLFNVGAPIIFTFLIGVTYSLHRKRKYKRLK